MMKRTLYVGCFFSACRGVKLKEQSRIREEEKNVFIAVTYLKQVDGKTRGRSLMAAVSCRAVSKVTCNSFRNAG